MSAGFFCGEFVKICIYSYRPSKYVRSKHQKVYYIVLRIWLFMNQNFVDTPNDSRRFGYKEV